MTKSKDAHARMKDLFRDHARIGAADHDRVGVLPIKGCIHSSCGIGRFDEPPVPFLQPLSNRHVYPPQYTEIYAVFYAPHSNYSGYPCEPKLIATNTTRDYRKNHETGFFSRLIDAMDAAKGMNEPANAVTYVPE